MNQKSTSTQDEIITAISDMKNAVRTYRNSIVSYTTLIVNPDFEYKSAGVLNDGTTFRGIPYGWSSNGTLIGNSFGINSYASNYSGSNLFWINSTPMPAKFELYQVINNLSEGEYTVRCRLASFVGQLTNVRLFANNNVQYYGYPADYNKNLSANEVNTFGDNTGSINTSALLQEMNVNVTIAKGQSLRLGILSGNMKSDGTAATDNSGWFKVDNFRLEKKTVQTETSVSAIENSSPVRVFNNQNGVCVNVDTAFKNGNLALYSIVGREVSSVRIKSNLTYDHTPTPGVYVAKIILDGLVTTARLVTCSL